MKRTTLFCAALFSVAAVTHAQVIFSDSFTYPNGNGTGFVLGEGLNSDINPPTTRITGTAAANLRYMNVGPKPDTSYLIQGNRMRVTAGSQSGRATISADGSTAFDFGGALGVGSASSGNPVVYDIGLTLDNNATGQNRMSFGFGTVESSAGDWDFGLQLHKAAGADDFYTVTKRMDTGSIGIADRNDAMTTLAAGSAGNEVSFIIRVTDAGAETDNFYNSRVQVKLSGETDWFYDSSTDTALINGFRFDGEGRFMSFDVAGGNSGPVTYDDVSITIVPEPSTIALAGLGGAALLFLGRRARNSRK